MSKKIKKEPDARNTKSPEYGNPEYDANEDIYSRSEKLLFKEDEDASNAQDDDGSKKRLTGEDLDVPGAELDDEDELLGEEDEENNYYSLGGDNHNDLEEDKG